MSRTARTVRSFPKLAAFLGVAALLARKIVPPGEHIVVVLSGSNIDASRLKALL